MGLLSFQTDYLSNLALSCKWRNTAMTGAATIYGGLFTRANKPTKATGGGTEVSGGSYARQAVVFGAPSAGSPTGKQVANTGLITYVAPGVALAPSNDPAGWIGFFDALTSGNLLAAAELLGPDKIVTGITVAAPGVFTSIAHGFANGDQVQIRSLSSYPGGFAVDTAYYVVNKTTDTFQLAATQGGTGITTTTAGVGTIAVSLDYTTKIGPLDVLTLAIGAIVINED